MNRWKRNDRVCAVRRDRKRRFLQALAGKSSGIDGLLVTVGLCIIALLLCVVMKDKLEIFIGTIVDALSEKAVGILG
ncbi:MAG: hypothetical protein NC543_03480 [bacterium]|nr:hypothetical protein [bacterium]MCM1373881.1 hypothetical protein [Muribaculum sp.]